MARCHHNYGPPCRAVFFSDRSHYKSDSSPTYSRRTPFQDEREFPEPVFGIAHEHPYNRENGEGGKEDKRRILPETERHHEDDSDHRFPPKYIQDAEEAIEKDKSRNHRVKLKPSLRLVRPEDTDASSSGEDGGRPTREPLEWGQEGDYGPINRGPPEESRKESLHRQQRPVPESSQEDYEDLRPRPRPPRLRRPHHPNERGSSETGDGSDFRRTDGKYYEDSGERSRGRRPNDDRGTDETRRGRPGPGSGPKRGKIVGVDMQMVAGMYPRRWQDRASGHDVPGRFSPLSGPYPEGGDRGERRKNPPEEWINGDERQPREGHDKTGHFPARKETSREQEPNARAGADPSVGSSGPQSRRINYGPFDGYFQRADPNSEEGPENSDQQRRQHGGWNLIGSYLEELFYLKFFEIIKQENLHELQITTLQVLPCKNAEKPISEIDF
ncbi:hypothetical protein Y032_0067g73 [Ancylostoma ceylanicum]|uniref:Uncharacterized protein n=1 Tax=Ancylostoma ceylanicum TaxID=53326 RepID=A0A016TZP0_9BILA|nr:hypothetical protein Y032_0067g73 [Ancylostoma ceylanicum]